MENKLERKQKKSFRDKYILLRKYMKRSRMFKVVVIVVAINLILGATYSIVEKQPFYIGLYWITDTITNTGTGLAPLNHGYIWYITTLLMWLGLGVTLIFVERVYVKIMQKERKPMTNYENHVLLIGWSQKMRHFIHNLPGNLGVHHDYLLIANIDQRPYDLPRIIKFLRGNPLEERTLILANAKKAQQAIIVLEDDADAIMASMNLQNLNKNAKLSVNILYSENIKHLKRIGVCDIICDEELTGNELVKAFNHHGSKVEPKIE